MNPQNLAALFDVDYRVLTRNVAGVSHEQSLASPRPGGNCLNWVVGHILASRGDILRLLGERAPWSEADAAPYRRGSPPLGPGAAARPFESLLADLERTQETLRASLAKRTPEDLAVRAPESSPGGGTVGETLAFLHFHEAYHAGQTGILRRFIGLPGAIA